MVRCVIVHLCPAVCYDRWIVLVDTSAHHHSLLTSNIDNHFLGMGTRLCNTGAAGYIRNYLLHSVRCHVPAILR